MRDVECRQAPPTIGAMAVHVDQTLPIHPLTVHDVAAMVDAGILREDDRVELLDGVLVEMSQQGSEHARAISRSTRCSCHWPCRRAWRSCRSA